MQGQRSAIGSLPDSINFDYGSTSSNVGIDEQICWNNLRDPAESRLSDYRITPGGTDTYMSTISQEGRNLSRWSIGESSSSNLQNPIDHDEQMTQIGWSSSISTFGGTSQLYEPPSVTSRNGVHLNLNMNESDDSNDGELGRVGADLMGCSNSSKPGGFEHRFIPSSNGSQPFASSSGSGGFLMEVDDGRSGCALDGRRLSCKRKTIEGNVGQSSNSMLQAVPPCYDSGPSSLNISPQLETSSGMNNPDPFNPRLELSMVGAAPGSLHTSSASSVAESSQRNYRVRTKPDSQQDSLPNNSFMPRASNQPLRLVPVNPPLELVTPVLPGLRRNIQSARSNGASRSRGANLSPSLVSREGDTPLNEDLNSRPLPRNISEHQMFIPSGEVRSNVAHNPPNWGLNGAGVGLTRHVGSSSRAGPGSSSHSTSGLTWGSSHRHPQTQYSRRLSEYVRRSLMSSTGSEIGGHSDSSLGHRSVASSSLELVLPSGGGSQRHDQPLARLAHWMERQGDGVIGLPYSLRALSAAGEGRSRVVSEIRNVLDIMRGGEGLRFEDVMILDPSVFFGMADIQDQHRDMRLDVDNMSYEELLVLEERIGNVCTGLSAERIAARMKQRKYISLMKEDQAEIEPCCICQEEYIDGEDLGTLDCGHDFHTECIKQWLAQKNLCPICKTTALST